METEKQKGIKLQGDIGIMNSFDGENYIVREDGSTYILSFSCQLFNRDIVEGTSSTASENIFTWQQAMCKENWKNLSVLLEDHYTEREQVKKTLETEYPLINIQYYDIHDGKMIYLLTQHSAYNGKFDPFFLCKCQRGDAFKSYTHKCMRISTDERIKLYNNSLEYMKKKKDINIQYKDKDHSKWADKHNFGITHFGVHPRKLDYDMIRFDTFHMICQITRKIMEYMRR